MLPIVQEKYKAQTYHRGYFALTFSSFYDADT